MELECRHKREEFIKSRKEESKEDLYKTSGKEALTSREVRSGRLNKKTCFTLSRNLEDLQ